MGYPTELHETILEQEKRLVFDTFSRDDAWTLGCRLRSAAAERGLPLVIGISIGGQRVFHSALPGASPDSDAWLERKARVVTWFERSSLGVGEQFRVLGRVFEQDSRLPPEEFAANGGVFPIRLRGSGVIGTVGVSGLPQLDDHAFVVEQLQAHLDGVGPIVASTSSSHR